MTELTRRSLLKASAWSVPVIAVAIAAPAAAASMPTEPFPLTCSKEPNHGHGGDTGNNWWTITYSDGSVKQLDNGTVMSTPELRKLCKK